jgi:hypothetical protein
VSPAIPELLEIGQNRVTCVHQNSYRLSASGVVTVISLGLRCKGE